MNLAERSAMIEGEASTESLIEAIRATGRDARELRNLADEEKKQASEMQHYHRLFKAGGRS